MMVSHGCIPCVIISSYDDNCDSCFFSLCIHAHMIGNILVVAILGMQRNDSDCLLILVMIMVVNLRFFGSIFVSTFTIQTWLVLLTYIRTWGQYGIEYDSGSQAQFMSWCCMVLFFHSIHMSWDCRWYFDWWRVMKVHSLVLVLELQDMAIIYIVCNELTLMIISNMC